jgi:nucleotide-binding universal stress UspA family protein
MLDRVLVAMDDSEMAVEALRYALDAHPEAAVTVLCVVGEPSPSMGEAARLALADDVVTAAEEAAADVLDRARAVAADRDVTVDTEVRWGRPARAIADRAGAFDLVVVGSHGGTVADRLFVGNVARTVVERSPVPVTVVR